MSNLRLAPAAVMPAQVASGFHLGAHRQPEKRLMLAVLEDAIAVYLREAAHPPGGASADFVAAAVWLQSPEGSWPFSFAAICRALGLEPSAILRGLRRWREERLALPAAERVGGRSPFRRMNGTRTKTRSHAPGLKLAPVSR